MNASDIALFLDEPLIGPDIDITDVRPVRRLTPGALGFADRGMDEVTPEAGAWKVITEGRESGKAGIYNKAGEVPTALIEDILASGIPLQDIIFEAPMKEQQVWFLRNVNWEANLGNIVPGDAIKLETLRLGLRSDTMMDRAARLGRMPTAGTGQALLDLVREVLKLPLDAPLGDETTVVEVPGWDSIANVNLFMEARARFRITMDFEARAEIESIGDLRREIEKQTGPLAT
jgi:acyl carrier protein